MLTTTSTDGLFFGLLELDAAGTVLYHRHEGDGQNGGPTPDLTGLNFFTDVAPTGGAEALREHFRRFSVSGEPARSFNLALRSGQSLLRIRVLLGRVRKRSDRDSSRSVLVHIKKAT